MTKYTREEQFWGAMAGENEAPEPITRKEQLMKKTAEKIAEGGSGGGGGIDLSKAVTKSIFVTSVEVAGTAVFAREFTDAWAQAETIELQASNGTGSTGKSSLIIKSNDLINSGLFSWEDEILDYNLTLSYYNVRQALSNLYPTGKSLAITKLTNPDRHMLECSWQMAGATTSQYCKAILNVLYIPAE